MTENRAMVRMLALVATLMMVAAACGDGGDGGDGELGTGPGFDGTTITLGVVTPQTGPVAVIGNPLTRGQQVFFESLNAAGGIGGKYKVELEIADSRYDAPTAVQQYNRLKTDVVMFAQLLGTPIVKALLPQLATDKIVGQPASLDADWLREPNLLALGGPYQIQAINGMDYWITQEGHADDTVCFAGHDDPYGDAGLEGLEFAATELGFEIAEKVRFAATDTDPAAQGPNVARLSKAGCDVVFLTATPSPAGAIMGAAAAGGFAPQWIGQSPTWVTALATSNADFAGYLAAKFLLVSEGPEWGDTTSTGMKRMIDDIAAYASDQKPDIYFAFGYASAWATSQVLEKAVELGDLSRDGIMTAMEDLGTVSTGGLLGDYEYGAAADRNPPRASRLFKVDPTAADTGYLTAVTDLFASTPAEDFEFPG